jgi:hypothetical protein
MTDLASLKNIEGAWMDVMHPSTGVSLEGDDGKLVRIRLVSLQSDQCQKVVARLHNEREKKRLSNRKYYQTAEEAQEALLKLLAAATLEFDGEQLKATPENCLKVYQELPWLREQVERFLEDWGNFLPKE